MRTLGAEKAGKFNELYGKYRDYVYRICYNILHNEHEAEDIAQASFLKVSKVLGKIDSGKEEKTKMYLKIIARNTAIDYYKKKQKICETEKKDQAGDSYRWEQVGDCAMDGINYQLLVEKISCLPERYADILSLRYVYGLSIKEITVQLSLSETNACARVHRAKKMLTEIIDRERREG